MPGWSKALEVAQRERGIHYYYLATPLFCRIPGGLKDGSKIFIHGVPTTERFSVNFRTSGDWESDYAFHLNPRFDENDVAMNSKTSGEWESEERVGRLPISQDNQFLLTITNNQQGYEVEVNNEWLALFNHRVPYENVTHFSVEGDLTIIGVHVINEDLPKDSIISIPGGIQESHIYQITGKCDSDCSRFNIDLKCGETDEDDVALHFNPRFGDLNKVIRNSYISGEWGEEDREGDFPFSPGRQFVVVVTALEDAFQICVDGNALPNYPHRLRASKICKLAIQGEAKLSNVVINAPTGLPCAVEAFRVDLCNPATPAKAEISDFKPGCVVDICGVVQTDPTRFKINLQAGPGDEDDVMLHVNPRWDQGDPKIVFNSREAGDWANEEMWSSAFPLESSSKFHIRIHCLGDGYEISVNDSEPQIVKHRIDCTKVNNVTIEGCIDLERVTVC